MKYLKKNNTRFYFVKWAWSCSSLFFGQTNLFAVTVNFNFESFVSLIPRDYVPLLEVLLKVLVILVKCPFSYFDFRFSMKIDHVMHSVFKTVRTYTAVAAEIGVVFAMFSYHFLSLQLLLMGRHASWRLHVDFYIPNLTKLNTQIKKKKQGNLNPRLA